MPLSFTELEPVYEALAKTLDGVAAEQRQLLLAKLCLALARECDDAERALDQVRLAARDLEPSAD